MLTTMRGSRRRGAGAGTRTQRRVALSCLIVATFQLAGLARAQGPGAAFRSWIASHPEVRSFAFEGAPYGQDGFAAQVVTESESIACRVRAEGTLCASAPNEGWVLAEIARSGTKLHLARTEQGQTVLVEWDLEALTVTRLVGERRDVSPNDLPEVSEFNPGWAASLPEYLRRTRAATRAYRAHRRSRTTRRPVGTLRRVEPDWRSLLGAAARPRTRSVLVRSDLSIVTGSFEAVDDPPDERFLAIRWRGRWHWGPQPEAEEPGVRVHAASERAGDLWLTVSEEGGYHGAWTWLSHLVVRADEGQVRALGQLRVGYESWSHDEEDEDAEAILNAVDLGPEPCVAVRRVFAWSAATDPHGRWRSTPPDDERRSYPVGFWRPGWDDARSSCEP